MHCQQHELSLSNKPKPIKAHHKLLYWNKMLLLLEERAPFVFSLFGLVFQISFFKKERQLQLEWLEVKKNPMYKNQTDQRTAMARFNI